MLKNMYGCGMYAESVADGSLDPNVYECTDSLAQPYTGSLFFMSFVTVTGLVVISMFIGVISIAMSGTIVEMRQEKKHKKWRILMKRRQEHAKGLATVDVDSIASIDEYNRTQKLLAQVLRPTPYPSPLTPHLSSLLIPPPSRPPPQTRTLLEGVHCKPTLRQPPTQCGRVLMCLAHTSTRIVTR
jgi:hypothetical protein